MASDLDAVEMRVVDEELEDKVKLKISNSGPMDFLVPARFTMKDVVAKIMATAGRNPIRRLTIMCHGYAMQAEGDVYPKTGEVMTLPRPDDKLVCKVYGGYGLALGKDGLNLATVRDFAPLKGRFTPYGLIVICGCAAADSGPAHNISKSTRLTGDGPGLMKALAAATGAGVVAAIRLQELPVNWYLGTVDRGEFVGPTYLFNPDGSQILNAASY